MAKKHHLTYKKLVNRIKWLSKEKEVVKEKIVPSYTWHFEF